LCIGIRIAVAYAIAISIRIAFAIFSAPFCRSTCFPCGGAFADPICSLGEFGIDAFVVPETISGLEKPFDAGAQRLPS
jgi:hypothetical protein